MYVTTYQLFNEFHLFNGSAFEKRGKSAQNILLQGIFLHTNLSQIESLKHPTFFPFSISDGSGLPEPKVFFQSRKTRTRKI